MLGLVIHFIIEFFCCKFLTLNTKVVFHEATFSNIMQNRINNNCTWFCNAPYIFSAPELTIRIGLLTSSYFFLLPCFNEDKTVYVPWYEGIHLR